jgi:hypothetical protein
VVERGNRVLKRIRRKRWMREEIGGKKEEERGKRG